MADPLDLSALRERLAAAEKRAETAEALVAELAAVARAAKLMDDSEQALKAHIEAHRDCWGQTCAPRGTWWSQEARARDAMNEALTALSPAARERMKETP